jgi:hypothetical protein
MELSRPTRSWLKQRSHHLACLVPHMLKKKKNEGGPYRASGEFHIFCKNSIDRMAVIMTLTLCSSCGRVGTGTDVLRSLKIWP